MVLGCISYEPPGELLTATVYIYGQWNSAFDPLYRRCAVFINDKAREARSGDAGGQSESRTINHSTSGRYLQATYVGAEVGSTRRGPG